MKKIVILGSGGSGKSTFARNLGEVIKLPVYHLDAYFWKPGWISTPNDDWDNFQKELIQKDKWIIDGNYGRTIDIRIKSADTIIYFDLSRWITTYRVIKRRIMYHGRTRPDLTEGCPEQLDWEFIKWVWNFKKNKRPGIIKKLNNYKDDKKIIIVRNPMEVKKLLERFKNEENIVSNFKDVENIP